MSLAIETFERHKRRLEERIGHAYTALTDESAKKLILGLEDLLRYADEMYALRLCERVTDKESDGGFAQAFTAIYENAKQRLMTDEYGQNNTSASVRFLGDASRRGDMYFVDRFEIVAIGLAEEGA